MKTPLQHHGVTAIRVMVAVGLLCCLVCATGEATAAASVHVSNVSVTVYSERVHVPASSHKSLILDNRKTGDIITVELRPDGAAGGWLMSAISASQLERAERGLKYVDTLVTTPPLILRHVTSSPESIIVHVFNTSKSDGAATYKGTFARIVPNSVVAALRKMLIGVYEGLAQNFMFQDFRISLTPCGTINAVSTPDITICSELVNDLSRTDTILALQPIIYHEVAHTLLRLWGDSRFVDEDIADELALVLCHLIHGADAQKHMLKLAEWLSTLDTAEEYVSRSFFGDKHSLSIVRIRNIQLMLKGATATEVVSKWSLYLVRHMTNAALRANLSGGNPLLVQAVRSELTRRALPVE